MTNSSNGTRYNRLMLKPWHLSEYNVILVVIYALVITAALVGNILICTAVCINAKLRKHVASYFIVSLALSDIGTASLSMTFDLETYITYGRWYHGDFLCFLWTTVYLITVPTSMWNLVVLSIDRYKTLKNPWDRFRASPFMTPRRALIIIATIWSCCLVFALIPFMGWDFKPPKVIAIYCSFKISPAYSITSSVLNFYLPMLAMCFIYYKIYEIARTQYLMPTGLEVKPNPSTMPSRSTVNRSLKDDPKEHENMNTGTQQNYESCKARGSTLNSKNVEANGLSNLGLELDNGDKTDRTRTFIEDIENINTKKKNEIAPKQNNVDSKDETNHTESVLADVNYSRVEDVILDVHKEDKEEKMNIGEEITEIKDQSTSQMILDHPKDSVDENVNNLEENDSNSSCVVEVDKDDLFLSRQTMTSQRGKEKDAEENLDLKNEDVLEDTENVTSNDPSNEPPELEGEKDTVTIPSTSSDENEQHDEQAYDSSIEHEAGSSGDESNHGATDPSNEPPELEGEKDTVMTPSTSSDENEQHDQQDSSIQHEGSADESNPEAANTDPLQATHPVVSLEMQTYLRKKVLSDGDREKSSSRESLQSTCTVQSTLPDSRNSIHVRNKHNLSASRDTLNSDFGSMDDLTKRRKIFVKNKKAARTISIIVSAFLVCWLPYTTYSVVMNICKEHCFHFKSTYVISQILLLFGYINSILNPIIFSYQNVQFRISYRKMIKKLFPCLRNVID